MAVFSLIVLAVAIIIGFIRKVNTGIIAMGLAFLTGIFIMGMKPGNIMSGFPTNLFLTLLGITSLFTAARVNGTLLVAVQKASRLVGRKRRLIPLLIFVISFLVSALGPGNPPANAIMFPIAMAFAEAEEIPDILMFVTVGSATQAGAMSPIATSGIIGKTLMDTAGMGNYLPVFLSLAITGTIFAAIFYFLQKAYKLEDKPVAQMEQKAPQFTTKQIITLVIVGAVLFCIAFLKMDVGLVAITGTAVLLTLGLADENETIKACPWGVYIMVGGISVLVNIVSKSGGIDALAQFLVSIMTPITASPICVLIGGVMSAVSSAVGVVLPTMFPTVPGMVEALGSGVTGTNLCASITCGAFMVAFSPFSTMGGLALASATPKSDKIKLFTQLLLVAAGGTLFSVVLGAVGFYGLLSR